jgi:hypothetical protein
MRALSLGLVKGSIDQIDKRIFISWVQPRVLDLGQVSRGSSALSFTELLSATSTSLISRNQLVEEIYKTLHLSKLSLGI